jgi:hypothetical protein
MSYYEMNLTARVLLVCCILHSLVAVAVGSHGTLVPAVDEEALAAGVNPVPDDDAMDTLYGIPALAQKLVEARADAEVPADAKPLLGPLEICECTRLDEFRACFLCSLCKGCFCLHC